MIAKLRYFVIPSTVLVSSYNSSILHLTYGLIAWGNASNVYLNKILVFQKRVLRLIYFVGSISAALSCLVYPLREERLDA